MKISIILNNNEKFDQSDLKYFQKYLKCSCDFLEAAKANFAQSCQQLSNYYFTIEPKKYLGAKPDGQKKTGGQKKI